MVYSVVYSSRPVIAANDLALCQEGAGVTLDSVVRLIKALYWIYRTISSKFLML